MSELIVEGRVCELLGVNVGFDGTLVGEGWLQDNDGRAGNEAMLRR